jgi:hypothetical protein
MGSPFQGTPEAAWKLTGDLKERHTARTLPSVFELLPGYPGAVVDAAGKAVDLTKKANWPDSVGNGLEQYCDAIFSKTKGPEFFARLLLVMQEHWKAMAGLDLGKVLPPGADGQRRWLPIAGIGEKTRVRVRLTQQGGKPWFEVDEANNLEGSLTGDGTVALDGAVPPFIGKAGLVCFQDDEIETGERASWVGVGELLGAASFHSFLPMMNAAQRVTIAFLRDAPQTVTLKARPAPGVQAPDWPDWLRPI